MTKPILFTNLNDLEFADPKLELHVNQPYKYSTVIKPTEPWESWAVLGYNDVLRTPDGRIRMYYDCIEGSGVPPGITEVKSTSSRRVCLAESLDGIVWTKPSLGIFKYKNPYTNLSSTENNILLEDSGVSVFLDPTASKQKQWKMVTSYFARSSPDGIDWELMCKTNKSTSDIDDTKPTAVYDPNEGAYVIYVRRDGKGYNRGIGRCVTDDLCDWEKFYHPNHCPTIFELENGNMADVYTNSYTPYPSIQEPSVHFFFPSIYYHFGASRPWGFSNDGLLDIQILASKDGRNVNFIDADKFPYVPLDVNRCGYGKESRPNVTWGWCDPYTGELANTSVATSVSYMASGFIFSNNGEHIFQYSSGQPFSHGGDGANKTWGTNSGIRLLINRRDGFTYIQSPPSQGKVPFLVIKLNDIPKCNSEVILTVNFETSVTGFLKFAVMYEKDYSVEKSDALRGSSLAAVVSWNAGKTAVLPKASALLLQVFLDTAKLYALELKC